MGSIKLTSRSLRGRFDRAIQPFRKNSQAEEIPACDGREVVVDTGDLGSVAELGGAGSPRFRPHIVHLSGLAVAGADQASFAFENESGKSDKQPATGPAQLFAANGVLASPLA